MIERETYSKEEHLNSNEIIDESEIIEISEDYENPFDWNGFVENAVNEKYILVIGSEVILKSDFALGNSSNYLAGKFSKWLVEKRKDIQSFNSFSTCSLDRKDIRKEFTTYLSATRRLKDGRQFKGFLYNTKLICEELRDLIDTHCFKIVITTSIDRYIESLMQEIWGKDNVDIINIYDNVSLTNFQKEIQSGQTKNAKLIYAFGEAEKSSKPYVISDEDAIDVLMKWIKADNAINGILDYFSKQNIIALGCKLDDWQFRFFWHMLKPTTIDNEHDAVVQSFTKSDSDKSLKNYLENKRHICTREDARAFMRECADKLSLNNLPNDLRRVIEKKRKTNGIFISYAHEDFHLARHIFMRLCEEGFSVWFDNEDLHHGDDYEKVIEDKINECNLFMPILTKSVAKRLNSNDWNFLINREWEYLNQRNNINERTPVPIIPLFAIGYNERETYHKRFTKIMGTQTSYYLYKEPFSKLVDNIRIIIK